MEVSFAPLQSSIDSLGLSASHVWLLKGNMGQLGIMQGGAPKIAKLVYNSNNYRTYGRYIYS